MRFPLLVGTILSLVGSSMSAATLHVAIDGDDSNPGTAVAPLRSIEAAQNLARRRVADGEPAEIVLHGGPYFLDRALKLNHADSGTADHPMLYRGVDDEVVTISGGTPLKLNWQPYRDGILQAKVDATKLHDGKVEGLFIDGKRQPMARFPNADPSVVIFNGYSADAISPERVGRWKDPVGAFVHALHKSRWGSLHFVITRKNADGTLTLEGGWQNNRPAPMHPEFRFVENVFEELDAPGEWYFDAKISTLYVLPPKGVDLSTASIEATALEELIDIHGTHDRPVQFVSFENITFTQTARTFMQTREPLLRSDWTIARKAAVHLRDAQDVSIRGCTFDQVGGNALFIDGYNARVTIDRCHIDSAGASGVCFVGSPAAVRNGLTSYAATQPTDVDQTPGPASEDFPRDCRVSNSLIHNIGRVEKQVAGVEIDIAARISVNHCSIYDTPRAGINIGDGCFGGHVIDGCDVFDTVLETGDHGSFNSWGRDRFWSRDRKLINQRVAENSKLPLLDVIEPIIIRNSRWRCDHGWDIDLDDGSSNYQITNNLCLNGGLKLREGYRRIVTNNILANSTLHCHVWLNHSQDVVTGNIIGRNYKPVGMPKAGGDWGADVDRNWFTTSDGLANAQLLGVDSHSISGDPQFADASRGNFQVKNAALASQLGFRPFPTETYGVTDPALRKLARVPSFTVGQGAPTVGSTPADAQIIWMGATVKSVTSDGEMSVAGLPDKSGVIVLAVPAKSAAAGAGMQKLDVIIGIDGKPVRDLNGLVANPRSIRVFRNQMEVELNGKTP